MCKQDGGRVLEAVRHKYSEIIFLQVRGTKGRSHPDVFRKSNPAK